MNERQLLEVKEQFPGSSRAIWSDEFRDEGCVEESPEALVEYIVANRHRLNPGVVFVSLNPSSSEPEAFSNFHSEADFLSPHLRGEVNERHRVASTTF